MVETLVATAGQKRPSSTPSADPRLQRLIDAWPDLSTEAQQSILAILDANTRR